MKKKYILMIYVDILRVELKLFDSGITGLPQ